MKCWAVGLLVTAAMTLCCVNIANIYVFQKNAKVCVLLAYMLQVC